MKKRNWKKSLLKFGKGSISLFLAMLMTPFMSIAIVLVETQRYNSVVSLLDETMGSSAISTLSNYDQYLADRWGLYAVDQSKSARDLYYTYFQPNSKILASGMKISDLNSVRVDGEYSLADLKVFEQQIREFCKLNIPMQAGTNLADKAFDEIKDLTGLGDALKSLKIVEKLMKTLTHSMNMIDNLISTLSDTYTLIKTVSKLLEIKDKLAQNYSNFKSDFEKLQAELKKDKPSSTEVSKLEANLSNSLKEYKKNVESVKNGTDFVDDINDEIYSDVKGFTDGINDLKKDSFSIAQEVNKLDSQKKELENKMKNYTTDEQKESDEYKALEKELKRVKNDIEAKNNLLELMKDGSTAEADIISQAVDGAESNLEEFEQEQNNLLENEDSPTAMGFYKVINTAASDVLDKLGEIEGWLSSDYIDSEGNKTTACQNLINCDVENEAYNSALQLNFTKEQVELMVNDIIERIDNLLGITKIINFIKSAVSIFQHDIFQLFFRLFDLELIAEIDTSFYQSVIGPMPGDKALYDSVVQKIKNIAQAINDIKVGVDEIKNGKYDGDSKLLAILSSIDPFAKIDGIKKIAKGAVNLVTNVVDLASVFVPNYLDPTRLAVALYSSYNCPCRTDYTAAGVSFSPITGGKFDPAYLPQNSMLGTASDILGFGDALDAMNRGTVDTGSAHSNVELAFSSCELEYVIFGYNSEVVNQIFAFFFMYIIRMLMAFPTMFIDQESCEIIASFNVFCFIPIILYAIAEPMLDMALLVKGADVKFFKTTMYCSSKGIVNFLEEYISTTAEEIQKVYTIYKCFNKEEAEKLEAGEKPAEKEKKKLEGTGGKIQDYGESLRDSLGVFGDGFLSMSYKDYCMVALVLCGTKEVMLSRLMNLVQMEGTYRSLYVSPSYAWSGSWASADAAPTFFTNLPDRYKVTGVPTAKTAKGKTVDGKMKTGQEQLVCFDLRKAYTYINVEVDAEVKQIMPSLIDSSLFSVTRSMYRGY